MSILITRALNSPSDRLATSSLLSSFCGVLLCSFIWAVFLCLGAPVKLYGGGALGIHQGGATLLASLDAVCGGWAREGTMQLACLALAHFPMNPPVRLGVSPLLATPAVVHSEV